LNLVGNAVKFTRNGVVSLDVRVESRTGNRVVLRFTVADNGIGIDAEAQKRLFKPFSQADASTTRRFGGTGLGLAICKSLLEQRGGWIRAHSTPGHGTRIQWALPDADARAQAEPLGANAYDFSQRYPGAANRDFDGQPDRVTEMDALVAYLQMLGAGVDFSTYQADTPENAR